MTMSHDDSEPLSSLVLFTHNVARVLKPSQDGELAHAIHETLHYALDGNPQDFLEPLTNGDCTSNKQEASTSSKRIQPGFFETNLEDRPYVSFSWDQQKRELTLPHPQTVVNPVLDDPCTNSKTDDYDPRVEFDVTAKFFFLQSRGSGDDVSFPSEWVEYSLSLLERATSLKAVDTMILAFPTLNLERNFAATKGEVAPIVEVWRRLSPRQDISSMGLSDLSQSTLGAILERAEVPPCSKKEVSTTEKEKKATNAVEEAMVEKGDQIQVGKDLHLGESPVHIPSSPSKASLCSCREIEDDMHRIYGPGVSRRPRLCSINLRTQQCNGNSEGSQNSQGGSLCWDSRLADFCKQQGILLVAHSDQKGEI